MVRSRSACKDREQPLGAIVSAVTQHECDVAAIPAGGLTTSCQCPESTQNALSCGFDMPNVPFLNVTESRITSQQPGERSYTVVNSNGQVGPLTLQVLCATE